ncbi:hypothetical protein, variant [Phytophthora nicotianae]|nr:hypothetical protein, variant [Phytophthora nicotianae P1569]ETM50553.1 hypothetical protein, variant [Phytophthora nicotianae]
MSYISADSPKMGEAEHYNALVQETSKAVAQFNQVTRNISQKMTLFGTPQDSRANHQQLTELTDRGNKLVAKINRRLQELDKGAKAAGGRARRTQVAKLSTDYKNQLKSFEETCQKLLAAERAAVSNLRQSSLSFRSDDDQKPAGFDGYNEDQIYAQANVTSYNEDDLVRREEDILKINQQLHEVNAAYQEVDGLVQDQGEIVGALPSSLYFLLQLVLMFWLNRLYLCSGHRGEHERSSGEHPGRAAQRAGGRP